LALRRENKEVLWSSMVKDTMKRKKPSFNEAYHGYRTFSELLEDAQKEGLLELETDKRSRTYVVTRFGAEMTSGAAPPAKPAASSSSRRRRSAGRRRSQAAGRTRAAEPTAPTAAATEESDDHPHSGAPGQNRVSAPADDASEKSAPKAGDEISF
jgi:hypothetical protein